MGEGAVHGFTAEALQGIATIKSWGRKAAERRLLLAATRLDVERGGIASPVAPRRS
jgi:hypothetical protein